MERLTQNETFYFNSTDEIGERCDIENSEAACFQSVHMTTSF